MIGFPAVLGEFDFAGIFARIQCFKMHGAARGVCSDRLESGNGIKLLRMFAEQYLFVDKFYFYRHGRIRPLHTGVIISFVPRDLKTLQRIILRAGLETG